MHLRFATLCATAFALASMASAQIYVSPSGSDSTGNGTAGNPYKTVTKAATVAAPGATIQLTAGVFGLDDQIEFTNKNLALVGSGIGQSIVKGHLTATKLYPQGTLASPTPVDHRCVITINGPARIDIRNLTVDGDFNFANLPSGRLFGVFILNGGDATIDNIEVRNCRANPIDVKQTPVGVVVRGDNAGDPCDVTLRGCYIHNFGKNGFAANFNTNLIVDNNTIVGAGRIVSGAAAQNCLQVSFGARGVVRNNIVKDAFYVPVNATATGIVFYDAAAGCVIEGNNVNSCQTAIYVIQSTPANRSAFITRNQCTESQFGIEILGQSGCVVTQNTIHGATDETAYDDTNANSWFRNNYSNWSGAGAYPILGGSLTDTTPRRDFDGLNNASTFPIGIGGIARDLLVANLNGVGGPDFATVNGPASGLLQPTISVALESAFPAYAVTTTPFGAPGAQPSAIAVGEFNGAAGLDLAVASASESRIYVFANNGAGVFTQISSTLLPVAASIPNDLAAGDFNGDGVDDLVVGALGVAPPGRGFILQNTGAGLGFTATPLPGTYTGVCRGVAVGRIDAGSSNDVVVTEGTAAFGRVHVYVNNGLGIFTELGISPISVENDPTSVVVGDLDQDGKTDLAVSCVSTGPGVVVLVKGDFPTAFTKRNHAVGNNPVSLVQGDISDDADPDTARRDLALVNLATGNLSLLTGCTRVAGFEANYQNLVGIFPRAVALGYMNNDVLQDALVADSLTTTIRIVPGTYLARGDYFGEGCPGTAGRLPLIMTSGLPALSVGGNASYGMRLLNARPLSASVLIASAGAAAVLNPCSFLLNNADVTFVVYTTGTGTADIAIPVPPLTPSLNGAVVYFQWGVLDPLGIFVNTFSLTQGLKIRVGN